MKPLISIILPVLNEQATINSVLTHLHCLFRNWPSEIIVVDGDARKRTLSVISDPEVKKISSVKGRGIQMAAGARVAEGDLLLFLHADTRLPSTAPQDIQSILHDKNTAACAFDLAIDDAHPVFRMIEKTANVRSRISGLPFGDQALCIKREWYDKVGGFRPYPLMEDVDLMRRLKRIRGRVKIFPAKVRTSARRWHKEGILYCTLRNWMILALYFLGVRPQSLMRFYMDSGR